MEKPEPATPTSATLQSTQRSAACGSGETSPGLGSSSLPASTSSGPPASESRRTWRQPQSVRHLASQASAVATQLLNGTLDLETAKAYGNLMKSIAGLIHSQVIKARASEQAPDLTLTEDLYDDDTLD